MRYLLYFFLCTISAFAQSDNISVVSAEKLNVVYRGVPNPIKIAVPGAKSFTATAPGLKADTLKVGHYIFRPGSGNEVTVNIEAIMEDGSVVKEEKVFRIKGLSRPLGTLYGNDSGYITLTRQELIDATLDISMQDFLFDIKTKVYDFELLIPDKERIRVEGNKMNKAAIKAIRQLKNSDVVLLDKIRFMEHDELACFPYTPDITVEINDNKTIIEED